MERKMSEGVVRRELAVCRLKLKGLLHRAEKLGRSAFSSADLIEWESAVQFLENIDLDKGVVDLAESILVIDNYFGTPPV